jgi:negative regulator of flagellin synthesis FlgM
MTIEMQGVVNRSAAEVAEQSKSTSDARTRPAESQTSAVSGRPMASDQFSLTDSAAQMRALESQIASLPVVDTQRVTEVQTMLSAGELQIKPAQVAEKLLSFELGMAQPNS